jgi:hypothetical protein
MRITLGILPLAVALVAASSVAGCSHHHDDAASSSDALSGCTSSGDDDDNNGDAPDDLACTGLYSNFAAKTLSAGIRAYAPAVPLWSDGADKTRYILLPDGQKVDASNMDEWTFPPGTKAWKEFKMGDRLVETRLWWKKPDGSWRGASYVWSEDGSHANRGEGQKLTVNGKEYDVPKNSDCDSCHRGRKDKLLGFEAISLAQPEATGLNLAALVAEDRINPKPARTNIALPERGLGVLHVNCGVACHSGDSSALAYGTGLHMRLSFDDVLNKPVEQWDTFTTAVGVDAKLAGWAGEVRVTPSQPDTSLIIKVMTTRGPGQMPPIATNVVDDQGVASVSDWIRSLPAPVVTGSVAASP